MTVTQVFQNGDGQAVRLPEGFEFHSAEVAIRREGESVILEPLRESCWPVGFFERIYVSDPAFRRPDQGETPPSPEFPSK
jgi:virulence-associated protein VagC